MLKKYCGEGRTYPMDAGNVPTEAAQRILDVAEGLVQTRGFNAFSYAHIAEELHVTKATLHYHFPSKNKLGTRLIERYRDQFTAALQQIIGSERKARGQLRRYVALYANVLTRNRMCLCGMLAAEYATLPQEMRNELQIFFDQNEAWVADVLRRGRDAKELVFPGAPLEAARLLISSLEGAMMLARLYGDPARFEHAAKRLLTSYDVSGTATRRQERSVHSN